MDTTMALDILNGALLLYGFGVVYHLIVLSYHMASDETRDQLREDVGWRDYDSMPRQIHAAVSVIAVIVTSLLWLVFLINAKRED